MSVNSAFHGIVFCKNFLWMALRDIKLPTFIAGKRRVTGSPHRHRRHEIEKIMVGNGHCMVIQWPLYGCMMTFARRTMTFVRRTMTIVWVYDDHSMVIQWPLYGCMMTIVWLCDDHCMVIQWPLYGYMMAIVWLYDGHCMVVQWPLYRFLMAVACQVWVLIMVRKDVNQREN